MLRVVGVSLHLVPSAGDKDQSQELGALGTSPAATAGLMHPLKRDHSVCSDTTSSPRRGGWGEAGAALTGSRFALQAWETYRKIRGQHDKPPNILGGPAGSQQGLCR